MAEQITEALCSATNLFMNEQNEMTNEPQISDTLLFGVIAAFCWLIVFVYVKSVWPPSILFLIFSVINLGLSLLFIAGRLKSFNYASRFPNDQVQNNISHLPLWVNLAPYGRVIGVIISSVLHYQMGAAANEIIIPIGIAIGASLSWMVLEHIIFLWHQYSK